jgi:protein-L-isoaspartate(D-aspartate) O-methyltransferase
MVGKIDISGIGMTSLRTRQRLIERLKQEGISNARVLDVMLNTPRHVFVDEALAHRAYEDTALPIGHQQTISQPYIVARMTELLLEVNPECVYEVGAGSGYQSMILAQLVDKVVSVERIKPLLEKAKQRARQLKVQNVDFYFADGTQPKTDRQFDGILAAAAGANVPDALIDLLADGGRLVMPVGDNDRQDLIVVDKTPEGIEERVVEAVRFVPMLSGTQK